MWSTALTQEDVPDAVMTQAEKWAAKLEKVDSNSTPLYLAQAYFQRGETDKAYAMLEKYVDFVPTQETTWDDAFLLLFQYSDDSQEFMDHILAFQQRMNDWNENHMGTITLSPQVQAGSHRLHHGLKQIKIGAHSSSVRRFFSFKQGRERERAAGHTPP